MTKRLRSKPAPSPYAYGEKPAAKAVEARAKLIDPDAFEIATRGGYWISRKAWRDAARAQAKAEKRR